jgi:hypothetical protein
MLSVGGGLASASPAPEATGALAPQLAADPSYSVIDVPNAQSTDVTWVNNMGVVVGYYDDATGQHGFIDSGGTITAVDMPGSNTTEITSINDAGTVTGSYWNSAGTVEHGFVRYANGTITVLDDPDVTSGDQWGTIASDVSNSNVVVGSYFTTDLNSYTYPDGNIGSATTYHGFVWKNGQFTTYDAPGAQIGGLPGSGTQLLAINGSSVMVGTVVLTDTVHPNAGFTLSGTTFTSFAEPTIASLSYCGWTTPNAINDFGTIAGDSGNGCAPTQYAWLLNGSQFTYVNYPGATSTLVSSVNNSGLVAGTWTSNTGLVEGFTVDLGGGTPATGPTNAPPPNGATVPASIFGTPTSATASSTASTAVSGTSGGASATITVPAGALPVGTTVSVYPVTNTAPLVAEIPAGSSYLFSFAVSWETPDGSAPGATAPIEMTITDPSIMAGDTIYELTSAGLEQSKSRSRVTRRLLSLTRPCLLVQQR